MLTKFLCALGAALLAAAPVSARGHVSIGIGLGIPLFAPPPIIYGPPVYYPPPIVYPPPPPPPPLRTYAPPPRASTEGQQCREYTSTSMIDGAPQKMYGVACRQPDGKWRIVQ